MHDISSIQDIGKMAVLDGKSISIWQYLDRYFIEDFPAQESPTTT